MKEVKSPYSIELYIGEKRSGKTLSMVSETYEETKGTDIKIYSNIWLNPEYFPNAIQISKEDLERFYENKEEFFNAYFLIDEIHIFMDSRKFGKKGNQKIGYFLGQMGKRGNVFRGTTHFPHLVDFRLRCYCEKWKYIRKGLVDSSKWKAILNNNKFLNDDENKRLYIQIKSVIRKLVDFEFFYIQEEGKYIKADNYFNYYDTEELLIPEDEEDDSIIE